MDKRENWVDFKKRMGVTDEDLKDDETLLKYLIQYSTEREINWKQFQKNHSNEKKSANT